MRQSGRKRVTWIESTRMVHFGLLGALRQQRCKLQCRRYKTVSISVQGTAGLGERPQGSREGLGMVRGGDGDCL